MAINIYDQDKKHWKQISSMLAANQAIVDAAGNYEANNVEDAFKEVADKMEVIKADLQYIYENGTIGGGGGGGSALPKVTTSFDKKNVSSTEIVVIPYQFTSPNIGKGKVIGRFNGVELLNETCSMGLNSWIFSAPLAKGNHVIELYVIDAAGLHSNLITIKLSCGELEIRYHNDTPALATFIVGEEVAISYLVSTVSADNIYAKYTINGMEEPSMRISKGKVFWHPQGLTKGRHVLTVTANIGDVESNTLFYTIAIIDSDELYIGSSSTISEAPENTPFTIPFVTSLKGHEECYVDCYIDQKLIKRMRLPMGEGAWTIQGLFKKPLDAPYDVRLIARTLSETVASTPLVFHVIISDNPYEDFPHHTENLIAWFKPGVMSNDDSTRNFWKNEIEVSDITCQLFDFNYINNGYMQITDREEDMQINSVTGQPEYNEGLFINGEAYAVVDFEAFAQNGGELGLTIETTLRVDNVGDLDAFGMFCATSVGSSSPDRGIWINTYQSCLDSVAVKNHVQLGENNWVRLSFVVDKQEHYAKIYIDGILSGITQINENENFMNESKLYFNCGINSTGERCHFGQCFVQSIKIYDAALTSEQIVKNVVAEIYNKDLQRKKALENDTESLPILFIKGIRSSLGHPSDVNKPVGTNFWIKYEPKEGGGFTHATSTLQFQGTSTGQFTTSPNYTFRTMVYGVEGDDGNGVPQYVKLKEDWEEEYIYTLKADYMDSSHFNNIGIADYIYSELRMRAPAVAAGDAKRCSLDGFPVLLKTCWIDEGDSNTFNDCGIYMLNLDRYSSNNYGLKPGCLAYEGAKNAEDGAVAFNDATDASIGNEWKLVYPEEQDMATHIEFGKLIKWVKESPDQNFGDDQEFETHLSLNHCIDYYLMIYVFGMIDNIGKNMRISSWGPEGGVDYKWYPNFYDLDTALGLNNEGHFSVKSYVEMDSVEEGASYNVKNSRLWRRLDQLYREEIKTRYEELRRTKVFDEETILHSFKSLIVDRISEAKYNFDATEKYYINSDEGKTSDGLQMAQGTRLQKVRRWLIERLTFCDSMFGYEPRKNNSIQFRTNTGGQRVTFYIKTYEPQYLTVKFNAGKDGTVTHFCNKDGFTTFVGTSNNEAAQNQEMFIYSAHNLMEVGGINGGTNVSSLFMQNATRLRRLDVSGSKVITELRVETMTMLQELILHSCPNLNYFINVSNCYNLKVLDAHGTEETPTPITGVSFAKGGSLTTLDLSYTNVSEIKLESQPFLREINLTGCHKLVTFSIIDCPKLEKIIFPQADLETFIAKKCANLESIDVSAGKNLINVQLYELDNLKTLDISRNYKISSVLNLTGCKNLKTLNADSCDSLKYIAFYQSASSKNETLVENLDFSNCANLIGIKTFPEMMGMLTEDNFLNNDYLDFNHFTALADLNFYNCKALTLIKNLVYVAPRNSSMFYNCTNLIGFENSSLTLKNVISHLFEGCVAFEKLPTFDLLNVSEAYYAFENCKKLTISHVATIMNSLSEQFAIQYRMFYGCTNIQVTGTNFPVSLFNRCTGLRSLSEMFHHCPGIACEFPENLLAPLKKATDFYRTFSGCKFTGKLKANTFSCITNGAPDTIIDNVEYMFDKNNFNDYDEGIFRTLTGLKKANGFFYANYELGAVSESIPEDQRPNYIKEALFAYNPNLTEARSFFHDTALYGKLWKANPQGGNDLPMLLFKNNKKLIDIGYFFGGTKVYGPIPKDLFNNADGVKGSTLNRVDRFFEGCQMSGTIPDGLFDKNVNLTDVSYFLNGNSTLDYEIVIERDANGVETHRYNQPFPPTLFQNKPELTYVSGFFRGCTGLVGQLPQKMFKGSPKVNKVNSLFDGCTGLTNDIPEDLLTYSKAISDVSYLFYECKGLTGTLPPLLFENAIECLSAAYAFYNCEGIHGGIPEGFLDNCVKLQTTRRMFCKCDNLTPVGSNYTYAIPDNLFLNCRDLSDVSCMFYECIRLKGATKQTGLNTTTTYGIPPNLFFGNKKLATTESMFAHCSSLSGEIPEQLFAQQTTALKDVSHMFENCDKLSKIYSELFGHIDSTTGIYDGRLAGIYSFEQTFDGCSALRGVAPQLWISHDTIAKGTKCYAGATQVDNYDQILNSWK